MFKTKGLIAALIPLFSSACSLGPGQPLGYKPSGPMGLSYNGGYSSTVNKQIAAAQDQSGIHTGSRYGVGMDVGWEVDLFGRLHSLCPAMGVGGNDMATGIIRDTPVTGRGEYSKSQRC